MAKGVYKHKSNQGFQKGNKINLGRNPTIKARENMSEAQKKAWKEGKYTEERNNKIGIANSISLQGHIVNIKTKKKISETNKEKMKKVMHHINGNHFDNRPENRMIMSQSEHIKLHWDQGDIMDGRVK